MSAEDIFSPGSSSQLVPQGDPARQAVASLRGYAYQVLASALAWLDIDEHSQIYLEVAEDYAIVAKNAILGVQVKDSERSVSVTLNSVSVRDAITNFVDLVERNPDISVDLRFFTTSDIGTEQAIADRPDNMAGLDYWKRSAAGASVLPLRNILESDKFPDKVRQFAKGLDDEQLRHQLIRRIHWDCGKPDYPTLRQEVEARLIVIGRERFNLPSQEASRLVDHLMYQVLQKSIVEESRDRVFTRADLYCAIDAATLVSISRAVLDSYTRVVSGMMASMGESFDAKNILSAEEPVWLVDGATLPALSGLISRRNLESNVNDVLENFDSAIVVGSSGLGKSIIARTVVNAQGGHFFMADFRNTNANETRIRLDMVFGRIGGMPNSTLILEDLNHVDDPLISLSLARIVEALRRRNRNLIVSCYRMPSLKSLTACGLAQGCIVECPYFSEEEASALAGCYGGDPERWGRLAHIAGGFGHPQLTHAFVSGLAARGWPIAEMETVLRQGFSSDNTDEARDAARQNLLTALPEATRTLLYRLSLVFGRFDRSMALTIGGILPPVSNVGERLDRLIGPWIEAVGNDLFRVSPLASGSGGKMLPCGERRSIHETAATKMLSNRTIDVSDIDAILVHALAGRSPFCLSKVAYMVLVSDFRTVEQLSENVLFFRFATTDSPIYPGEPLVSVMLRLAQFKLAAATGAGNNVSRVVAALFKEIDTIQDVEAKWIVERAALPTVLGTMGIANHLDDWVVRLLRLQTMVEKDEFLQERVSNLKGADDETGIPFLGGLFSIGSANLASVDRLEHIISQLDELDNTRRALLLTPVDKTQSDYSSFINGPWLSQRHDVDFDSEDAAVRYGRIAERTRNWSNRLLSLQCSVAQAIMLDEYQNDWQGALAVLHEARGKAGDDPILSRAMAKVHHRHNEHDKALRIFRGIANNVGIDSPIERAFAMREAAVSAAECGEWRQAEKWFLDARDAASLIQYGNMAVLAIGLGADSAVAALETGNSDRVLVRLSEALEALSDVNPDSTLCAAYCHRVVRHTVLWAQSRIERSDIRIGGQPTQLKAGTCSNPDPLPAVRDLPLGHIDVAWYLLAEMEAVTGLDVGILGALENRLVEGRIPILEVALRLKTLQADMDRLDAVGFSNHYKSYLESSAYMLAQGSDVVKSFDTKAPERDEIPTLDLLTPFDAGIEQAAKDAILAYAIHSALTSPPRPLIELQSELRRRFSGSLPGESIFVELHSSANSQNETDKVIASIINVLVQNDHLPPYRFWLAGLRLFEWICHSRFHGLLVPKLAKWQRSGWTAILAKERFNLVRPMQTVPPIEGVLMTSEDDRGFVARLLIATSDAMGTEFAQKFRQTLEAMAEDK